MTEKEDFERAIDEMLSKPAPLMEELPPESWSPVLVCNWISWSVVKEGILRLDLPYGNCCDMQGAIANAKALDSTVHRIEVYADRTLDRLLVCTKGKWTSYVCSIKV